MSTAHADAAPPRRVVPTWTLADRLRKIRREVLDSPSQEAFAEQLGVKANAYSAWESGRAKPRDLVALAQRIELLTGVPATWTLGLADGPNTAQSTATMGEKLSWMSRTTSRPGRLTSGDAAHLAPVVQLRPGSTGRTPATRVKAG